MTGEFKRAHTILFYASFDGEVETFEMMKQTQRLGKQVVLPTIIKDQKRIIPSIVEDLEELSVGPYGIKQPKRGCLKPISLDDIHLVLVPGVAFDRANHRLGRGGGYYDRFLKDLPLDISAFGLAFDFQIVENFPFQEEHDIPVTKVIFN